MKKIILILAVVLTVPFISFSQTSGTIEFLNKGGEVPTTATTGELMYYNGQWTAIPVSKLEFDGDSLRGNISGVSGGGSTDTTNLSDSLRLVWLKYQFDSLETNIIKIKDEAETSLATITNDGSYTMFNSTTPYEFAKDAGHFNYFRAKNINASSNLVIQGYGNGNGRLYLKHTRGSFDTPYNTLNGNTLGSLFFSGTTTSSNYLQTANTGIKGMATETFYGASNGAKMMFFTCSNGSSSATDRLIIDQDGSVQELYTVKYAHDSLVTNTTLSYTNKHYIFVYANSGDVTISLPDADTYLDTEWIIKRMDETSNVVTIDLVDTSDKIDGVTDDSFTLNSFDSQVVYAILGHWTKH